MHLYGLDRYLLFISMYIYILCIEVSFGPKAGFYSDNLLVYVTHPKGWPNHKSPGNSFGPTSARRRTTWLRGPLPKSVEHNKSRKPATSPKSKNDAWKSCKKGKQHFLSLNHLLFHGRVSIARLDYKRVHFCPCGDGLPHAIWYHT